MEKKENIVDYARRMRELCGLTMAEHKNPLQDEQYMSEDYKEFSETAEEESHRGFKIYEIEQQDVKKLKEDQELYKI